MFEFDYSRSPANLFSHLLSLRGKRAVITGGGSGIGRATARFLSLAQAELVVVADMDAEGSEETVRLCAENPRGGQTVFQPLDVTSDDSCRSAAAKIESAYGGAHIIISCAGRTGRDAKMDADQRASLRAVNVLGLKSFVDAMAPQTLKLGWGRIINVGSVVGLPHIPFPLAQVYKDSKAEVHAYTLAKAWELRGTPTTVNAIAPGRVFTDMVVKPGKGWVAVAENPAAAFLGGCATQGLGRMLLPHEVAAWMLFLCSPMSAMMSGTIIDLSSCWGSGFHQAYRAGEMPPAFAPFCEWAQTTTPTPLLPSE